MTDNNKIILLLNGDSDFDVDKYKIKLKLSITYKKETDKFFGSLLKESSYTFQLCD